MQFNELIKEIKTVVFEELRKDEDNYFEAVVSNHRLADLTAILEKSFGLPVWPFKNKLTSLMKKAIKDFGDIREGQILYWNEENGVVIAMLWPWQDGVGTTVKIIKRE